MTPIARAIRTFLSGLSGVALAASGIAWATDWRPGAITVGLALASVTIASVAAFFLAHAEIVAFTPLGKAFAQFSQMMGAGLGALAFNTVADFATNTHVVVTLLITALFSALMTLVLNKVEA